MNIFEIYNCIFLLEFTVTNTREFSKFYQNVYILFNIPIDLFYIILVVLFHIWAIGDFKLCNLMCFLFVWLFVCIFDTVFQREMDPYNGRRGNWDVWLGEKCVRRYISGQGKEVEAWVIRIYWLLGCIYLGLGSRAIEIPDMTMVNI